MNVPLFDLKAQNGALAAELNEAFQRVLQSGYFILGPEVERFEAALAAFSGAKHALSVSSGTDAILLALMALGIGPGDEVLCPSFTFFATAGCIVRAGATPVFVDSCPVCFNLDLDDAARHVTPRTRAIMPVHLFGQAADMDGVAALAKKHDLRVIEDAAQALGAGYHGRAVGTLGDCAATSFFPTKNLGAFGDAGGFLTDDPETAARARIFRVHGMEPKYFHRVVGGNFRLDALQAALIAVKLPHFESYTKARRRNAALYAERLSVLPGARLPRGERTCTCGTAPTAKEDARLILPAVHEGRDSIWNQYTLRLPGEGRRDRLRGHLAKMGVGSEIYYPLPLHEQECFRSLGCQPADFPWAHRLAGEVVSIPIYPELGEDAIERVCHVIGQFLESE